jgi:hypothetical protein
MHLYVFDHAHADTRLHQTIQSATRNTKHWHSEIQLAKSKKEKEQEGQRARATEKEREERSIIILYEWYKRAHNIRHAQ